MSSQTDPKWKLLLSDVHTTLGHILLENQSITDALKEYETALSLRQTFSTAPNHQRGIAEAHYFLAVAHSNVPEDLPKAVNHFTAAQNVLEEYTQQLPSGEEKNALLDTIKDIIIKTEEMVNEAKKGPVGPAAQGTQERQGSARGEMGSVIDLGVLTGGKKIEISKVTASPEGTPLPQPTFQINANAKPPNPGLVDLGTLQGGSGSINLQSQVQPQNQQTKTNPNKRKREQQQSPSSQKDSKKKKTK
uniref:Tetratricopeptide SHNi-TPR domain-containing protein n=1 Tax=Arcella intermedia TaxID=1963864 RepID=A0A6B2LBW0_9EUKA